MSKTIKIALSRETFHLISEGVQAYWVNADADATTIDPGDWLAFFPKDSTHDGRLLWGLVKHRTMPGENGLPSGVAVIGFDLPETWTLRRLIQALVDDIETDTPASRLTVERFFHDRRGTMLQSERAHKLNLLDLRMPVKRAILAHNDIDHPDGWQDTLQEAP